MTFGVKLPVWNVSCFWGPPSDQPGPWQWLGVERRHWPGRSLCGSYVALWQCPFDCALARGAGPSQIRENSRMCLFTHRPCLGVWVRRVCWDPVPTNPGFPWPPLTVSPSPSKAVVGTGQTLSCHSTPARYPSRCRRKGTDKT